MQSKLISTGLLCLGFALSQGSAQAQAQEAQPPEQTYVKIIETPMGLETVYDAAKDPAFIAAVETIYARGDVTFGDVTGNTPFFFQVEQTEDPSVEYVRKARAIQRLDMLRIGCRFYTQAPCSRYGLPTLKTHCPDSELGSSDISACEKTSMSGFEMTMDSRFHMIEPWETQKYKLLSEDRRVEWVKVSNNPEQYERKIIGSETMSTTSPCVSRTCQIGDRDLHIDVYHYIGAQSDYSLAQTQEILAYTACAVWQDDAWYLQDYIDEARENRQNSD